MSPGVTEGTRSALRDIHGLDPAPWWPLTNEAWLTVLLICLIVAAAVYWIHHLYRYPPGSWHREAERALLQLRRRVSHQASKTSAGELSLLLRRIAMARFGRRGEAGREGDEWLRSLAERDPHHFDWLERGKVLIHLPYAPDGTETDTKELRELINAAIKLVGNRYGSALAKRGHHV